MDRRNFAFDRVNFILLAAGMVVVIIGFLLMSGPGSTETVFNPDVFSARRIKAAPLVSLVGFLFMVYAIVRRPIDNHNNDKDLTNQPTPHSNDLD